MSILSVLKEINQEAKNHENTSKIFLKTHETLSVAVTLFQIAIATVAIAVIAASSVGDARSRGQAFCVASDSYSQIVAHHIIDGVGPA